MAKRFTDTDKWKKAFIKSLPCEYKLFWLFIIDECDHAGVWHIEMEVIEARLGIKLSIEKIRGLFKGKVVEFDGGTKLFIPDFIHFQYGELNPANKAHKSVINILTKYKLMGHVSPLQGAMDMDKDMDKDKDKESEIGIEKVKEIAREVWKDQGWREMICMGSSVTEKDLQKWMAQFNASVCNDKIENFTSSVYKKIFRGFLNKEISKGVSVSSYELNDAPNKPARLKTINS